MARLRSLVVGVLFAIVAVTMLQQADGQGTDRLFAYRAVKQCNRYCPTCSPFRDYFVLCQYLPALSVKGPSSTSMLSVNVADRLLA